MTRMKKSLTTTPESKSPHPTTPRGGEKSLTPDPSPKGEGSRMFQRFIWILKTVLAP
jgi:hypothetical protein